MRKLRLLVAAASFAFSVHALANPSGQFFDRSVMLIFENTNYSAALQQPFFKQLADGGALFSNFLALAHPSQGNYIALTSGSLNGVTGDGTVNLNVKNVADLLEAKGLTWKVYVEAFPGVCYKGTTKATYARKHEPFVSYTDIQNNPARCANIVSADQFEQDVQNNSLPNYSFYVPDLNDDGHNTSVSVADRWYEQKFSKYVNDPKFMARTVLISTFDESEILTGKNQIYTSIYGPSVKPGVYANALNTISLLVLAEQNWGLGNLGKDDVSSPSIPNIWK